MNNNRPVAVSGQIWYDTQSSEIKIFDGTDWVTINKMKPIQNDIKTEYIWKRKFAFMPHRCKLSGNIIWLKYGMYREHSVSGWAGSLIMEYRWHDEHEHLNWVIANA